MGAAEIGLGARARALAPQLVTRTGLEVLADTDNVATFAERLSRLGIRFEAIRDPSDVFAIDRAIGLTAARHLQTLHLWQQRGPGVLDVFFADQDRRSLRAMLRGAVQGAPSRTRFEGLMPTPTLPHRLLIELASHASAAAVIGHLQRTNHPDAARLLPHVTKAQPDLFQLELALLHGFGERAGRAAARGDETLREFVSNRIDLGNAQNALLIADEPHDIEPASSFVRGGRHLSQDQFVAAARAGSRESALSALRTAFAGSPLASLLPIVPGDVEHLDRTSLVYALKRLAAIARRDPLCTAPLLYVLLRVDAQSRDLRTLLWGAALGTPPSLRKQQLVTS